ncbi:nitrate- and nitrite sensing domain-containing protein [Yinghuangia sp. YIM S09857]|uniref:sensor histidine kinase n=1 Tax=Yinghuangia sp. YIM S09857 TaxID=3436929 RepID=UPI003F5362E1
MTTSTPLTRDRKPSARPPRVVRIRTLLILLAVVVTVALGAQVAFTAVRLLEQADNIRDDSVTGEKAGLPSYMVMEQIQSERRLTAARLGGTPVPQEEMEKQRAATDKVEADFMRLSGPELPASDRFVYDYVVMVKDKLAGLDEHRRLADTRTGDPQKILDYYNGVVDQMIRLYQEMSNMDDGQLTYETRPLVGLMHAFEALSREDALIALSGPGRKLTDAQYAAFAHNVGVQRFVYGTWVAPYLPAKDKALYDGLLANPAWGRKTAIEDAVLANHTLANGGVVLPADVQQWQATREQLAGQLTGLNVGRVIGLLDNTFQKSSDLRRSAWWLVGGSTAAVLFIVGVVLVTIRTVIRRTNKLRGHALDLAGDRLPDIITSLQRGSAVDTSDLPAATGAKDEIGQIGDAVATLARQAADGAELVYRERQGFERFAEGVTGRSVVLVGTQLRLLDDLMRVYDRDPELIARLYGLDHQTVRLRRQIENLQVLSGGVISNQHEAPAHIANLLMDAAGEAAGHERVEKHFLADARVIPSAASELTHVLAELIENAARYSPPDYKVVVRAQPAVHGVTVEVEDRGMGLTQEQYDLLNERLGQVPLYAEMADNASQLGLFVVGRLAARLGLDVTLRRSVYGGTAAVVLVPRNLLAARGDEAPVPTRHEGAGPWTAPEHRPHPDSEWPAPASERLPVRQAAAPVRAVGTAAAPALPAPRQTDAPRPAEAMPRAEAARRTDPAPVGSGEYRLPPPVAELDVDPLPKRSRGEHLAAQLRDDTGAVPHVPYDPDSPEAARDMYRGLQAAFDQAEQPGQFNQAGHAEGDPATP